jgi:hypothetical protein
VVVVVPRVVVGLVVLWRRALLLRLQRQRLRRLLQLLALLQQVPGRLLLRRL